MMRNSMFIPAILVSALLVGVVSANEIQTGKTLPAKKGGTAVTKKNKDAVRDGKNMQTGGNNETTTGKHQDPGKTLSSDSKKRHDNAEKLIDNLK